MLTVSVQRDSDGQLIKNFTQTTFERTMFPVVITDLPVDTVYRSAVSVSNTLGSAVVRDISFSGFSVLSYIAQHLSNMVWLLFVGSYVVQDFSVTQSFTNGTTCLSCVLLRNGMTTGCLISMQHADQTLCRSEVELQLLLSNETTSTVANSSYLVSITGCTNQSQLVYEGAYSLYATSIGSSSMTHTSMQKMVRLKGLPCNASPSPATTSTSMNNTYTQYYNVWCVCVLQLVHIGTNSEGVILPSVPSRGIGREYTHTHIYKYTYRQQLYIFM